MRKLSDELQLYTELDFPVRLDMIDLIDQIKVLEAHYIALPTVKLDDGSYLSWKDLGIGLICLVLWIIVELIICTVLFGWLVIPNIVYASIGIPFALFMGYLVYHTVKS
jgi:hypothetical protein